MISNPKVPRAILNWQKNGFKGETVVMSKRKALGKGLSALIPQADPSEKDDKGFLFCPVAAIEPNPGQPRKAFGREELAELTASVKEKGIITPLLVSKTETGYRLIAGERRWRAAKLAGLKEIPVVVRETTPLEALELALIENIHRQDLNPLEEALAYKKWLEDSRTTQEVLAKRLGKDRSTITNMLRLLNLPPAIQEDIVEGRITMGHARVLAGLSSPLEQERIRGLIIEKALSVRQTEELVKSPGLARKQAARKGKGGTKDAYLLSVEESLKRALGTKVEISHRGGKGRITLYYYSSEELDRLLERLS
jgi:ParB family chromosome partitioning protein